MKIPFLFLFRARDKPQDAMSAATTFSFGKACSGKSVNARTVIQVSTVYACVRVITRFHMRQTIENCLRSVKILIPKPV